MKINWTLLVALILLCFCGTFVHLVRTIDLFNIYNKANFLGLVTKIPFRGYLIPLLLIFTSVMVYIKWKKNQKLAIVIYLVGLLIASTALVGTVRDISLRRSRAVRGLPMCDTGLTIWGDKPSEFVPGFSGPKINGYPCLEAHEDPREYSSEGSFFNGLHHVWIRFPDDVFLVFYCGGFSILGLLLSFLIIFILFRKASILNST